MPHPVLTARQESHPLTSVFWYMVPGLGIEDFIYHIDINLIYLV